MNFKLIFGIVFSTYAAFLSAQSNSREIYIERFQEIAISEAQRTGVPASIKLAQGILESNAGQSTLAKKANNHFGIKCHNDWNGKKYYREDDDYDENGKLIKSCFRVYKNADASYIAHSEFLRDPKKRYRYGFLFTLPPDDYKAWARGLKDAGYATSPTYAQKLIRVIEDYELYRFDRMDMADIQHGNEDATLARLNISRINDVKVTFATQGETPAEIAGRTGVSLKCILKYNEKLTSGNQKIKADTRVFLQPKRNNFRGKKKWHYVKEGETMFYISQIYGLKLSKLYKKNRLKEGTEPAIGERIKIRGWFKVSKDDKPETGERPELEEEVPETPIEIEIPVDPSDDEDFGDGIVPEIPEGEFIDDETETDPPEIPDSSNPDTATPDTSVPDTDIPPSTGVYYTTQRGDTLFSISRRYGTTVEAIKVLNNLTSNAIGIGQRLRIF